ncbi:hypothetical protein BDA99DRAFT_564200 [Phascolomyces articulosus]|uniref:Uncharacterized protein n=1 Tax=Phascolomyces articulosus TaxID=60185 RepID=A0AAD5K173_9FUNG|nr:hypothetical protein BDA99DRAFT_564200 [Phascolomyces articulosus]
MTYDKPLLRLSREDMEKPYPAPYIEMCSQNSTMTVVQCDLMYMNWSMSTIPNCYDYIQMGDNNGDPSKCYLFRASDAINFGILKSDYDQSSPDIRRIDIYWKIDSIVNVSIASVSVPSISMELYNPSFNRWDEIPEEEMIPQQAQYFRDMVLGNDRSSTSQNTTTTVFFTPHLYRAIRPRDPLSLLGFEPKYVEIPTLKSIQLDWPLQQNINITRGDYHGLFNVQLSKASYDVQTEQRQHTLLAAVALAGGAYGVLTTLYILLFGMIRHAPFGLANQLPMATIRGVEKIKQHRKNSRLDENNNSNQNYNNKPNIFVRFFQRPPKPSQHLLDDVSAPAKSDTPPPPPHPSSNTSTHETKRDSLMIEQYQQQHAMVSLPTPAFSQQSDEGSSTRFQGTWDRYYYSANLATTGAGGATTAEQLSNSSMHSLPMSQEPPHNLLMAVDQVQREQRDTAAKAAQIEQRLLELQEVLRAYYINMDYLDQQRNLRRRGRQRSVYYDKRSNSIEGGWLFDTDDDDDSIHKSSPSSRPH